MVEKNIFYGVLVYFCQRFKLYRLGLLGLCFAILSSVFLSKETVAKPSVPSFEKQGAFYRPAHPNKPLRTLLPAGYAKKKVSLFIDKAYYRLTLKYEGKVLKSYPVVFGFGYGSDKLHEGDGATPEGVFKVRDLYPHDSWRYFIWLDYPTSHSWAKHKQAKAEKKIPRQATIGGEIGIHGVPSGSNDWIQRGENWTAGCVSLTREDIFELYSVLQKGTIVEIK